MADEGSRTAGVEFEDAMKRLMVSRRTLFSYVEAGKIGVVEGGRRGRGAKTMLDRADVERLSAERVAELKRKLSQAEGGG